MINTPVNEERTSAAQMEHILGGEVLFSSDSWCTSHSLVQVIKRVRSNNIITVPAVAEPLLVWIVSGEARIREREPAGEWQEQQITKGCFYLTTSTSPYEMEWQLAAGKSFTVMHVYLDTTLLDLAFKECYGTAYHPGALEEISGKHQAKLRLLFELCYAEISQPQQRSPTALDALMRLLAFNITRLYGSPQQGRAPRQNALPMYKLNKAKNYMLAHLVNPFSLPQLAAHCGMSEYYFSRQFKQSMGVSPSAWFIAQRMEIACRLLRETSRPVIDIALEVGYSSHSHFSQVFKKTRGMKPAAYRRQ